MPRMDPFIVRAATAADVSGIARVHVDSWRSSYKGIIPDDYLASLNYADREAAWNRHLPLRYLFVAERNGRIEGFASGLESREPEFGFSAELTAIYLYASAQGNGMGKALFNGLIAKFKESGHSNMHLWVLANNKPAIAFYQRMGGHKFTEKTIMTGGIPLLEHGYCWQQL